MGLSEQLTIQRIRQWAGAASYGRGEEYFHEGRVIHLVEHKGRINATVAGTQEYRVRIWDGPDGPDFSCDCPVGMRDDFCKHCVATVLAWLALRSGPRNAGGDKQGRKSAAKNESATIDVRDWLESLEKNVVTDLLMDAAAENEQLHNRLMLKATAAMGANPASLKKLINKAIGRGRFIDYHQMPDYWRRIDAAIDGIEEMLGQGHADAVVELSEYTLARVERAIEHVDDSDGFMSQLLWRLQEIHLSACVAAKPDPVDLAERLFRWELEGDWDTFSGTAQRYADVFGESGMKHYRELAEAEWARVKPLKPGDQDPDRYGRRFRITRIMESLALVSGDVEDLVSVRQRDLSSSYAYLEIADAYRSARKTDKALAWAEQGRKAFGNDTDSRLLDLLAELYHKRKRHDDAMALIWPQFERHASLATYQKLNKNAGRSGTWPQWRQRALQHIRQRITKAVHENSAHRRRFDPWADRSLPVEIFLWEKEDDTAWQEACEGGCADSLWMELARRREDHHPHDAIEVYRKLVGPIVGRTNNQAYAEAVVLIRRMKKLMKGSGSSEEFRQFVETLRREFKRKRNFMKMLDSL